MSGRVVDSKLQMRSLKEKIMFLAKNKTQIILEETYKFGINILR